MDGAYSDVLARCALVAGPGFPATDIVEEKLVGGAFRVSWRIGDRSFELDRVDVFALNEGVVGPNRFYDPDWDMIGYLIFLSPEQADLARKLRDWHLLG